MATLPNPNPITNSAYVLYSFVLANTPPETINTGALSNIVSTTINQGFIDSSKFVTESYAIVGDTLNYTIVLRNTGNVSVNNLVFRDTIPSEAMFTPNSVYINGSQVMGANPSPPIGVTVGTIPSNSVTTLVYRVTVTTLPSSGIIQNSGTSTYNYTKNPSIPNGESSSSNTNIVTTNINYGFLTVTKRTDETEVAVNVPLKYIIGLRNIGNTTVNNVRVIDTVPNGTNFLADSFSVNGVIQNGVSPLPPNGALIGNIGPLEALTVTFDITANTIPSVNPILNNVTATYKFTSNPSVPNGSFGSSVSNTISNKVNLAEITLIKSANRAGATLNDIIIYTIAMKNSGNVSANNVVLIDTIPNGSLFIENSVTVNGIVASGADPNIGINPGTIPAGATTTVAFSVTVNTIPTTNSIINSANSTFSFTGDPTFPNYEMSSSNSNIVTIPVSMASLATTKSVNRISATVGNTLNYTIVINNSSIITANAVTIVDTIPRGTIFDTNSLRRDGSIVPGNPAPPSGINIGTINPLSSSTITFSVTVISIPNPNSAVNFAQIGYRYTVDPNLINGASGSINTNTVTTNLGTASITSVKSSNKMGATLNDIITYSIALTNTGNLDTHVVTVTDTIPSGITFNPGSAQVNGVTIAGSVIPPTGINVGTITPMQTTTLTFKATVTTIPTPSLIINNSTTNFRYTADPNFPDGAVGSSNSNAIATNIGVVNLSLVKSANKTGASVSDVITYTIALRNNGNTAATSITFTDTIPPGASFITDSLTINGVTQTGASPNPSTGVTLASIPNGTTSTITFRVTVITIPSSNRIINNSTAVYRYTVDPSIPNGASGSVNSNAIITAINQANLYVNKYVDKTGATINDYIQYTIPFRNGGNTVANQIIFTDTIPEGTEFVANSVAIDGVSLPGVTPEPGTGIFIGSVDALATKTLTFNVVVVSIPSPNTISNFGTASYRYSSTGTSPDDKTGTIDTNNVSTVLGAAIINPVKSADKAGAGLNDVITYYITLRNTGNLQANSVKLIDTIPSSTTFVPNSLMLNGVAQIGASPAPPTGFTTTVPAGVTQTISFKVNIVTIPTTNIVTNGGSISYKFTSDPSIPNGSSGGANTNAVVIPVGRATLTGTKTANKGVTVGETITYLITLSNIGNIQAGSTVLVDTVPNGTVFNATSVVVGGIPQLLANPQSGIAVGSIAPSASITVQFTVTVNTVPTPNPIPNSSYVSYKYIVDPSAPNGISGNLTTNIAFTNVGSVVMDPVKSIDRIGAKINEIVTYTVGLKNTGISNANLVTLIDTIPNGLTFVTGSLKLNNITQTGANPNPPGFLVGTIPKGTSQTITFKALVNTIPSPNPAINYGSVNYRYTVDPSVPNGKVGGGNSNGVSLNIALVDLVSVKSSNKLGATLNDNIVYTVAINNPGNAVATNIALIDTIPNGTTFILNSVYINGIQAIGRNPAAPFGIPVGNINPGSISTVTFQVSVNTIPSLSKIVNTGNITYKYTVNPAVPNGEFVSNITNAVTTSISIATLKLVKTSNKSVVVVGNNIQYTIGITNTGNIMAENIMFFDTSPSGTMFSVGSVTLDNVTQPSFIPDPPGFSIGNIAVGATKTVKYLVTVTTLPSINPILNSATTTILFTPDPSIPQGSSRSDNSNILGVKIANVEIRGTKSVNKIWVEPGEAFTYTVVALNSGNTDVFNAILIDTLPLGTSFINGSFKLNGTVQSFANPNTPNGANLFTIPQGQVVTATFDVRVDTIAAPNSFTNIGDISYKYKLDPLDPPYLGMTDTNTITNTVLVGEISLVKTVDKANASLNNLIIYTIIVTNIGTIDANFITIIDTLPNGATLVPDTVTQNGIIMVGESPMPPNGISIGSLMAGEVCTITFGVKVSSIPSVNPLVNKAFASFKYTIDPSLPNARSKGVTSNSVTTNIKQAIINIGGGLVKSVDKLYADTNEEITYSISMKNTGNVTAYNVVLTDTIPQGGMLVPNSVTLGGIIQSGKSIEPPNGITVGDISSNDIAIVTFKVVLETIPDINPIINNSTVSFSYILDPSLPNINSGGNSNSVKTQINHGEISKSDGGLIKSADLVSAIPSSVITYTIAMKNTGNVAAVNVRYIDTIPTSTKFNTDYGVYVNDLYIVGATPKPPNGVFIGTLKPGDISTLNFQVQVDSNINPTTIVNVGWVDYGYTVDPILLRSKNASNLTNPVTTPVGSAVINNKDGGLIKFADKIYVDVSDNITYTICVKNTGNIIAKNVMVYDTTPSGTTFVGGSILVDGFSRPNEIPDTGILLGTIPVGVPMTITYMVKVESVMIASKDKISNTVVVTYDCSG